MDISSLLFIDTETTGLVHGQDYVLEVAYAEGMGEPVVFHPLEDYYYTREEAVRLLNKKIDGEYSPRVGDLNHAFERWGERLQEYPYADEDSLEGNWERLRTMHNSGGRTTIGQNVAFDLWMLSDNGPTVDQFTTYKSIDLSSYSMGFFGKILAGNKPPSFASAVSLINESDYPDKEPITQLPDHTAANDVRAMQQYVRELAKIQRL